jgi:phage terminase large subunit
MRNELTQKQRTFAHAWIKNGGNDYQAAIEAGYSPATAKNAKKNIIEKHGVKEYIAELQAKTDKENGYDIMSLADIQRRRSMIATGALQDSFGFTPDFPDQLKAMNDLEKALTVQAKEEEEKKAREEALRNKTYHMDLDIIPDVFHPMVRDIRNHGHTEYVLPGGRGSSKSSTIPNIITELMRNDHNMHALVVRQVYNTVKDSVYAKTKWAITKQEFTEKEYKYTSSPYEITMKDTGQKVYFRGADDPDKIKSISPVNALIYAVHLCYFFVCNFSYFYILEHCPTVTVSNAHVFMFICFWSNFF